MSTPRKVRYKRVAYGILKPDNTLWMSESCICEDADVLRNEELSWIKSVKCKVVPLYVRLLPRRGERKK